MNVIKLTLVNGDPVWISVQRIDMMVEETEVNEEYKVTQIWIGGSEIPTQVKEPASAIATAMRGLREVRS